jgi:fused signal recognition particle receptor
MFHEAVGVTGIVLTKLDGTSRVASSLPLTRNSLSIKFIGIGEAIEDLRVQFEKSC